MHIWEAVNAGVPFSECQTLSRSSSIHSERATNGFQQLGVLDQLAKYGYWDMTRGFIPGCYHDQDTGKVRGVIANYRQLSAKKAAILVGYGAGYSNVVVDWQFKPYSDVVVVSLSQS